MASGRHHHPSGLSEQRVRAARRGVVSTRVVVVGFLLCALALVPWIFLVVVQLPDTKEAQHWAAAWTGLDVLEVVGLVATAALARRHHPAHRQTAAATAALLVVDAWFDTVTSAPGPDLVYALLLAFLVELPLAAVCVWVAAGRPAWWRRGRRRRQAAD